MKKLIFVLLICLSLCASNAWAVTRNAATCSQSDVQTQINAANDDDIILVPAGECTWGTAVTITSKQITLQGAGDTCANRTKTASGHPPASCTASGTNITVTASTGIALMNNSKSCRVTGFRFNRTNTDTGTQTVLIDQADASRSNTNGRGWMVDNCYFNGGVQTLRVFGARNYGVFANNLVYGPTAAGLTWYWGVGAGEGSGDAMGANAGNVSWSDPVEFGSAHAVFEEDNEYFINEWTGGQAVGEGTAGQRRVIRYCLIRGMMVERHGACSGSCRGSYWYEYYENDIYPYNWNGSSGGQWAGIRTRGGPGRVWNNRFYGTWDSGAGEIFFDNQRSEPATVSGGECLSPLNVVCNGSANGLDTIGIAGRANALCLDQISAGSGSKANQPVEPTYVWGNTNEPEHTARNPRVDSEANNSTYIVLGRDYYNSDPGNYTPLAYPHPTRVAWGESPGGEVPSITVFDLPLTYDNLTVPITTFTATDNVGVTGYLVKTSSTPPLAGDAGWTVSAPTSFTFGVTGVQILYAWVKDVDGNISASANDSVTIDLNTYVTICPVGCDVTASSGNWTVPEGVTTIVVEAWGGGGKGSTRTSTGGGGGGGGGAYAKTADISVTPAAEIPYVIGAGSTTTAAGASTTWNTDQVVAVGGASVANNTATGALGGAAASSTGATKFNGGRGYTYSTGTYGAGGGGSGGYALAGVNVAATNATSYNGAAAVAGGGPGGNGSTATNLNASAPISGPGGGGGGARRSSGTRTGGNGFAGMIRITYPPASEPIDVAPPVISNMIPSGSQACTANPLTVLLQVATDESAICKWDSVNTTYASMGHTFEALTGTLHVDSTVGFDCSSSYTVYVRCQDTAGNANTQSSTIQFSVANPSVGSVRSMRGGSAGGGVIK